MYLCISPSHYYHHLTSAFTIPVFTHIGDYFLSVSAKAMADGAPSVAMEAVLKPSCDLPEDMLKIQGYDFNKGVDHRALLKSFLTTGFQASSMGLAIQQINQMVRGKTQQHTLKWQSDRDRRAGGEIHFWLGEKQLGLEIKWSRL